jgi:DNA polymerase
MDPKDAAAILRWWLDAGVDIALEDAPIDRFAAAKAPAPATVEAPIARDTAVEPTAARKALVAVPPQEAAASARKIAVAAISLQELRAAMEAFDGCALKSTATQLVFADGSETAKVMFVGEAPGADEDRIGRPFVGRAGQLLDKMLAAIGLDRSQVYIVNVVPWRPPGNRTPTPQETSICLPFLQRQIELVGPRLLVCLGASAAQTMLGVKEGILRLRGRWFDYAMPSGGRVPTLATLHPAYLLRAPLQKRLAWSDLLKLKDALDKLG